MKIGVFDSGVGGLTILRAIVRELPEFDYYYYGDTKHLPYGDKTEAEVYTLSVAAMRHLFSHDCALVVIACNTASAETLRRLQDEFLPREYPDRRILGVIIPTIETLIDEGSRKVLLLATKRTVESKKYEKELLRRNKTAIELTAQAAPELVPLIEAQKLAEAITCATAYVDAWEGRGDTVVLGCTHYTLLTAALREKYSQTLKIISQDEVIPQKLSEYLSRHEEIRYRLTCTKTRTIHLTEHRPDYTALMSQFLGGVYLPEENT
ncbi:MAG: glutamate racemase [Patescibacteria group bacterium]